MERKEGLVVKRTPDLTHCQTEMALTIVSVGISHWEDSVEGYTLQMVELAMGAWPRQQIAGMAPPRFVTLPVFRWWHWQ